MYSHYTCFVYAVHQHMHYFITSNFIYIYIIFENYKVNFYIMHFRSQLAKTKIDSGADNEKKDDSGNETGAGEGEPEEEPEIVHYDKSKSFFDNISCEAVERSKG